MSIFSVKCGARTTPLTTAEPALRRATMSESKVFNKRAYRATAEQEQHLHQQKTKRKNSNPASDTRNCQRERSRPYTDHMPTKSAAPSEPKAKEEAVISRRRRRPRKIWIGHSSKVHWWDSRPACSGYSSIRPQS